MIKILIADDHAIVRAGVKQILSQENDIAIAGEAATGKEVINLVNNSVFDMVLLDISMPGKSGIEILKQIKLIDPNLPVLILSMYPEKQYAIRSLRAGASGYLTKGNAADELVQAIRHVSQGEKYITTTLASSLASAINIYDEKLPHERLSDREFQVLRMLAAGKTVSEIAQDLTLSVKTISTHRARVLEKMALKNNSQLIHYAVKHKLVD